MIDFLVMKFCIVYTTCGSKKDANTLASALLEGKLIVCANVVACESVFLWKGKAKKSREWSLLLKTATKKSRSLVKKLKEIHPYEVPCIALLEASTTEEYLGWIHDAVSK